MASDQELATLYSHQRAAFLSRHFAIGRLFRTNHFSEMNRLPNSPTTATLLGKNSQDQEQYRWNRTRDTDNPLLEGSLFLTCLAVEDSLGHPLAPTILHSVVTTLKSLYKFTGNHFAGYPLRWDPTSSDRWRLPDGPPTVSDEFLVDASSHYIFSNSATDPRHWPRRKRDTLMNLMGSSEAARYTQADETKLGPERGDYFDRYRRWEISMDELVGLVTSYSVIHKLCTSAGTRSEIERQANNLGDYLAEHAWLLIRPSGGLNARGAAGILPALSFPLNRSLQAITGNTFTSRTNFEGAMRLAGCWNSLSDNLNKWTIAGAVGGPLIAPLLTGVIASLGLFAFVPEVVPLAGIALPAAGIPASILAAALPIASVPLARTYAIYDSRSCFDVKDDAAASEVAAAFFLMEYIPPKTAFQGWIFASGFTGGATGSWSAAFPPFLALTAIDDTDTTVRDAYFGWLAERHKHPNLEPATHVTDRPVAEGCFASAVAVLLGAGAAEEARLKMLLDQRFATLTANSTQAPANLAFNGDLPIVDAPDGSFVSEVSQPALDFHVGLALAWLHSKRRADAGNPVTTPGFPALPSNILLWPAPAVSASAIQLAQSGAITLPLAAIQGAPPPNGYAFPLELFQSQNPVEKSDIPPPVLPSVPTNMVIDRTITVHQSDGDVNTGIVLDDGDDFEIAATGSIWPADVLHGANGPNGWSDIQWDDSWPLFGSLDPVNAHSNSLLGRLGGYFFIGEHRPRSRFLYHQSCPLWLRINSKSPGGGSGAFQVRIQVWSNRTLSLRTQIAQHGLSLTSISALARNLSMQWPPPPTLSLRFMELVLSSKP